MIKEYVQEKDDEFERLLHDEQEEVGLLSGRENRQVKFLTQGNEPGVAFGVPSRNSNTM